MAALENLVGGLQYAIRSNVLPFTSVAEACTILSSPHHWKEAILGFGAVQACELLVSVHAYKRADALAREGWTLDLFSKVPSSLLQVWAERNEQVPQYEYALKRYEKEIYGMNSSSE